MLRDPIGQGYRLLDAVKGAQISQRRNVKIIGTAVVAVVLLMVTFSFLYDRPPASPAAWELPPTTDAQDVLPRTKIALCDNFDRKGIARLLEAEKRYQDLRDDKFTIVIQTYKRPDVLKETIRRFLEDESELIDQFIIIWNDLDSVPPSDWYSPKGVRIHYQRSEVNSLNQKLKPQPRARTKAILLGDDDTYYTREDLDFAFNTWRNTGRNRLVGAWPRTARLNNEGRMYYVLPRKNWDYNIILTGLSFVHIAFLDYYSSDDRLMVKLRDYVDERFNCEDIAFNYVTQSLTGCPAIWVKGRDGANMTPKPKEMPTIGNSKGHSSTRNQCLNDFNDYFGRNPLIMQAGYLIRAALHGN